MEGACEGAAHGMTGTEWRAATALFTAGEVSVVMLVKGHASHVSRRSVAIQSAVTQCCHTDHSGTIVEPVPCNLNGYIRSVSCQCKHMADLGCLPARYLILVFYHAFCSMSCLPQACQPSHSSTLIPLITLLLHA